MLLVRNLVCHRMCENSVLRKIRERETEEVTAEWDGCMIFANCSPNRPILLVMQSRMARWVGHVARVGRREMLTAFWWGKVKERDHSGDIDVDERVFLKCMGRHGLDSCGLG